MSHSETVPVIDVAPYLTGGEDDKHAVARALAAACTDSGFFCITGHGIDENLIARTRHAGAIFFARPLDQKQQILRDADRTGRGYYPVADRALAKTLGVDTPPDLQEAWVMTREHVPDDPYFRTESGIYFFGANKWPDAMPEFRTTVIDYFESMARLGECMMGAMALALGLKENFFADKIDKATNQFRFIHYPPQQTTPEADQLRAGAHTDYGALTMLRSDDVPGTLQVKLPRVGWTDIRPPPGAFICNLGDAMARWTGGSWASTLHRVGNPPPDSASRGRISLVFFHQPNYDAVLGGIGDDGADADTITLGEHHIRKISAAVDSTPPAA